MNENYIRYHLIQNLNIILKKYSEISDCTIYVFNKSSS